MKYKPPPRGGHLFLAYFYRPGGGAWPPWPPPGSDTVSGTSCLLMENPPIINEIRSLQIFRSECLELILFWSENKKSNCTAIGTFISDTVHSKGTFRLACDWYARDLQEFSKIQSHIVHPPRWLSAYIKIIGRILHYLTQMARQFDRLF